MPEGPFGFPRPFISDDKRMMVILGIDGEVPPRDILIGLQNDVNNAVNDALGRPIERDTVSLTTGENPTSEQKKYLGEPISIQQYDIDTGMSEISSDAFGRVEDTVVFKVDNLGFTITDHISKVV